jgi:hypothetical protein
MNNFVLFNKQKERKKERLEKEEEEFCSINNSELEIFYILFFVEL